MLAAGCRPIVNEAPNTTMVPYGDYIKYAAASPHALSNALSEVVDTHSTERALKASQAAHAYSWDASNERIEQILINDLR